MNSSNRFTLALLAAMLGIVSFAQALTIDGGTILTNHRFANDGSFVAAGMDLSGVGTGGGRWGTLVAPNIVLTANHFIPNSSLTFYATNDSSGPSQARTLSGPSMRLGSTDLYLAVLNAPLSSDYAVYDFMADATPAALAGENLYLLGHNSFSGSTTSSTDVWVGRNLFTGSETVSTTGATGSAVLANYDSPTGGVTFESIVEGGDSGAPLFYDEGGELTLVGTNWIRYNLDVTIGTEIGSGSSFTGDQASQIRSFINANAVPEPNLIGLFGLGTLLVLRRRR